MLSAFYKKFSLDNLKKDKPSGQIATLLILIIAAILIMILTTVNLGQLSISSTNLSNVADSCSLLLASQLASRANQISMSLVQSCGDPLACCQTTGMGAIVGAILGAIAAILIITPAGFLMMAAIGAAGGFVGGAAGGAYSGTGVLQGAVQGAVIGAAIGGACSAGAALGAGAEAANTAGAAAASTAQTATAVNAGVGMVGEEGAALMTSEEVAEIGSASLGTAAEAGGETAYLTAYSSTIAPYAAAGGAAGGTILSSGSSLYSAYVSQQNQATAMQAASRMLNGLPDYDRIRETVFLQAFSQTVDDPNKDLDSEDLNGNGRVDDKVSHFLYWWDGRMKYLKGIIPSLQSITNSFFNGSLNNFVAYAQGKIQADGNITKVVEGVKPAFLNSQDDNSFNATISWFNSFISDAQTLEGINISTLTAQWQTYINIFYNENYGQQMPDGSTITDYYHTLDEVKGYLSNWIGEIQDAVRPLASCQTDNSGNCANFPCRLNSGSLIDFSGTVDANPVDEITPALNDINALIAQISAFQDQIKQYVADMNNAYAGIESGFGGVNPAKYSWTDSRGDHSVGVTVGPYLLPTTYTTRSGNWLKMKICIRLALYNDNGSRCWVQITRQDPSSKDLKSGRVSLGMWNPFFSGKISKISRSSYSYNSVGLSGTK